MATVDDFKSAVDRIGALSVEEKVDIVINGLTKLAPVFKKYNEETKGAIFVYSILSTCISADGKLTPNELALFEGFNKALNLEYTTEESIQLLKDFSDNESYKVVTNLKNVLTPDETAVLCQVAAAICTIDNNLTRGEFLFICDLIC